MSRIDTYTAVAEALENLSDDALAARLDRSHSLGAGIGGSSALLTIDGRPVFVKRVRLTELETRPTNFQSTANIFELPLCCQYRVASPGFGVWREVATHQLANRWVLSGQCEFFPLMYHWRVFRETRPGSKGIAQTEEWKQSLQFWGDSGPLRQRLQALHDAQAEVAIFLEYVPQTLHQWLGKAILAGTREIDGDVRRLDDQISTATAFMSAHGLTHFDFHFDNVLMDGTQIYVSDFGLALSDTFELSNEERAFLVQHRYYDQANAAMSFVIAFVQALLGHRPWEELLQEREHAADAEHWAPTAAAAIVRRYTPTALALKGFFRALTENRAATFPAELIERLLADAR